MFFSEFLIFFVLKTRCHCNSGLKDPYIDQPQRMGRECMSCDSSYCNNRGTCSFDSHGTQACTCTGFYYG